VIVVVNQEKRWHFDLTLRDSLESFADLNINTRDLDNAGLWKEPWTGYRPWSWPLLSTLVARWEERVAQLMLGSLDSVKVLDAVGLRIVEDRLPRQTLSFLEGVSGEADPTIAEFVRESGQCLSPRDVPWDAESMARIASARLARWVEILVAGCQDVVADGPHVVARYPRLIGAEPTVSEANATVTLEGASALLQVLEGAHVAPFGAWFSRPTWSVDAVAGAEALAQFVDPAEQPRVEFVFCEDASRFVPRSFARRFIADLPTAAAQRFVLDPASVEEPSGELCDVLGLGNAAAVGDAFRDVTYAPGWRFSQ
jgi:hypothetical protein